MTILERPLASGIELVLKNTFGISDSEMKGSLGDFTLSEDGQHIFMSRYFINPDLGESRYYFKIGKYLIPPNNVPTNAAGINASVTRVDIGHDMLGIPVNDGAGAYFSYIGNSMPSEGFTVFGLQESNGKLIVNNNMSYGALGIRPQTTFVFDSTDLNAAATAVDPSTTVEHTYSMLHLGHTLGQMSRVEPEWQTLFGGSIFSGAGQTAITSNYSKGTSVGTFSESELIPNGEELVTIGNEPLLYYPTLTYDANNNLKGLYDKTVFTPSVIAQMDAMEGYSFITDGLERNIGFLLESGELTKNTFWNRTSKVITTFIVPNTRTLAVASIIRGGTREPYYKNAPTQPYEFQKTYSAGVTYAVRDGNGVPVPLLDANGQIQPPIAGFVYKAERWIYNKITQDYYVSTPTDGDSTGIHDDKVLSIHLFDTVHLQEVKDGSRAAWNVAPYKQQVFRQPLAFTANDGPTAIPASGDYNPTTGELYLSYASEYAKSPTSFYPLINVFDVIEQGAESATSTARLAHSDVPDGPQSVKIWSELDNSLLFDGELTFSGGVATTTPLAVVSNTAFYARWLGGNPPTTGTGIYGVTQYV